MWCKIFGHKWRCYGMRLPEFWLRCVRCDARKDEVMDWEMVAD